jgi:hypothetical protein
MCVYIYIYIILSFLHLLTCVYIIWATLPPPKKPHILWQKKKKKNPACLAYIVFGDIHNLSFLVFSQDVGSRLTCVEGSDEVRWVFFFLGGVFFLFICAYNIWVISPPFPPPAPFLTRWVFNNSKTLVSCQGMARFEKTGSCFFFSFLFF